MATIRDVARLAGVSISTVSLALNDSARVSTETFRKVQDAANAAGFTIDPVARSLKSGSSRLIGIVVGDVGNPFFGTFLREVQRVALDKNHLAIVSSSRGVAEHESQILDHLAGQRVAGIILSPHGNDQAFVDHINRLSMPIVFADHKVEGVACDFIGSDHVLAAAMLTEHLIRFGHRRIALIAGETGLYSADRRTEGFLKTMASAGLSVDPGLVVDAAYDGERAYAETMRLLTRAERPTALLAANNVMALGALQAIMDLGFNCPADISLTCIDDVPWSNVIRPRLTMAVQPVEELARAACTLLFDRIGNRGNPAGAPRDHILTPRLIVGQSCARPYDE